MDGIHRILTQEQEVVFRKWARDNHTKGDLINPIWHPVVIDECNKIDCESPDDIAKSENNHRDRIKNVVTEYFDDHASTFGVPHNYLTGDGRDHIINCGTSILCTKWDVSYAGGSFVQAVVNNDLAGTVGRADSTNTNAIRFYVSLMHNTSYVK